jgi:superfamily II helicase
MEAKRREMACTKVTPYWSTDSDVYHVCSECSVGNNIESDKRRSGYDYGNRTKCDRCKDIEAGKVSR